MSTFNSFVGGSDIVIISKSVLPNESIRYQIEFEFSTPDGYSVYTWNDDKFHDEFSVLFEHFYNNGSRVTNKNDKLILEGDLYYTNGEWNLSNLYIDRESLRNC